MKCVIFVFIAMTNLWGDQSRGVRDRRLVGRGYRGEKVTVMGILIILMQFQYDSHSESVLVGIITRRMRSNPR